MNDNLRVQAKTELRLSDLTFFLNTYMKLTELLSPLAEAHSWAILPATMALYNKRTVSLIDAAAEWKSHDTTILVCKNEQDRTCFVSSASDAYDHYVKDIGKRFPTHHDQTGASKGMYKIVNVVVIKGGEIKKKANEEGLKEKASLAVFK